MENFGFPNSTMYILFLFMFSTAMDCAEQVYVSNIEGKCKSSNNGNNSVGHVESANLDATAL